MCKERYTPIQLCITLFYKSVWVVGLRKQFCWNSGMGLPWSGGDIDGCNMDVEKIKVYLLCLCQIFAAKSVVKRATADTQQPCRLGLIATGLFQGGLDGQIVVTQGTVRNRLATKNRF